MHVEEKTCCFTGHRPAKFSFKYNENAEACIEIKNKLRVEILNMIINHDVRHFITGMALGVDTWAAEIVLEMKELYAGIFLTAAVPFPGQSERWSSSHRTRYTDILNLCDDVKVISSVHSSSCMMQRNRYMVDNSDFIIAVWNGSHSGGTAKTVKYAEKHLKKPVIISC